MAVSYKPVFAGQIGTLFTFIGAAGPGLLAQSNLPLILPTSVVGLLCGTLLVLGVLFARGATPVFRGRQEHHSCEQARAGDPPLSRKLNRLRRRSASGPHADAQHGGSPKGAERIAACWADTRKVPQIAFNLPIGLVVFPWAAAETSSRTAAIATGASKSLAAGAGEP